jgi:glycerophosphoryl diester phosphodiesterase
MTTPYVMALSDVPAEDGLIVALWWIVGTAYYARRRAAAQAAAHSDSAQESEVPTKPWAFVTKTNLPTLWSVTALATFLLIARICILAGANPLSVGHVFQPLVIAGIALYCGVPLLLAVVGTIVQWSSIGGGAELPATVAALCVLLPAIYLPGSRQSLLTRIFTCILIFYLIVVPTGVLCLYSDWQSVKRGDPLPITFGTLQGMVVASIIVDQRSEKLRSFLAERHALGGTQTVLTLLTLVFGFSCVVAKGFLTSFSAFSLWPFVIAFVAFAKALGHPTIDAAALRVGRFAQAKYNYLTALVWLMHGVHVFFWLVILLTVTGSAFLLKLLLPICTFLLSKGICWMVGDDEWHEVLALANGAIPLVERKHTKGSRHATRGRLVSRDEFASNTHHTRQPRTTRRHTADEAGSARPGDTVLGTTTSTTSAAVLYHAARTIIAFFLIGLVVAQGLTLPVAILTSEPHKLSILLYIVIIIFYMLVSGGGAPDLCVVGHRGVWIPEVPENTYEAVDMMLDAGGDGVEVDVRATADNVLIIMHDSTLDRTTAASGPVLDYTYEELLTVPVTGTTNRIPTLEEMIIHVKAHPANNTHINVDLKPTEDLLVAINQTIDLLFEHGMENRSLVASGEYTYVNVLGERHPNIRVQRDALWYQSPATVFSSAAQYTGFSFELLICNPGYAIQLAAVKKKLLLYYLAVDNTFTIWMGRLLGAEYILINTVDHIEAAAGGPIDGKCSF